MDLNNKAYETAEYKGDTKECERLNSIMCELEKRLRDLDTQNEIARKARMISFYSSKS